MGLVSVMKGEPLVTKLAVVAKYVVLPAAMVAALIYSPPDYALPRSPPNSSSSSKWRDRVSKWDVPWSYLFTTIIWYIWKVRNLACLEGVSKPVYGTAKMTIAYAKEFHIAFASGKSLAAFKQTNLVSWAFPPTSFIKPNADGVQKEIQEPRDLEGSSETSRGSGSQDTMEGLAFP